MRLTALLPHLKGLRVDQTVIEDHVLTLLVRPTRRTAVCPVLATSLIQSADQAGSQDNGRPGRPGRTTAAPVPRWMSAKGRWQRR